MDNTTAQFAQTDYFLLKKNKNKNKNKKQKNRREIRIYIPTSVELSGLTILLLEIPKFLDSIGKFLKVCTQQTAASSQHASAAQTAATAARAFRLKAAADSKQKASLCHQFGFDRFQEINKLFPQNNSWQNI